MKPQARTVLAVISVVGFILLTISFFFLMFYSDRLSIPENGIGNRLIGMFGMVVGIWNTAFATVINFNFGSSQGSKDKQEILSKKSQ